MTKNIRITYRRRHCYRTNNNRVKPIRTPGGKLVAQYIKKRGRRPVCGDTGVPLQGIKALRPSEFSRTKKFKRTVTRAYGGVLCANAVKDRIMRAFLVEEQKVAKKIMAERARKAKKKERDTAREKK